MDIISLTSLFAGIGALASAGLSFLAFKASRNDKRDERIMRVEECQDEIRTNYLARFEEMNRRLDAVRVELATAFHDGFRDLASRIDNIILKGKE